MHLGNWFCFEVVFIESKCFQITGETHETISYHTNSNNFLKIDILGNRLMANFRKLRHKWNNMIQRKFGNIRWPVKDKGSYVSIFARRYNKQLSPKNELFTATAWRIHGILGIPVGSALWTYLVARNFRGSLISRIFNFSFSAGTNLDSRLHSWKQIFMDFMYGTWKRKRRRPHCNFLVSSRVIKTWLLLYADTRVTWEVSSGPDIFSAFSFAI